MGVDLRVTAAAGATASSAVQRLPGGQYIYSVAPIVSGVVPHGRAYLIVWLLDIENKAIGSLWSGYVCSGAPMSIPGIPVYSGLGVRADLSSNSIGATTVKVHIETYPEAPISGSIFYEAPGSGDGEGIDIAIGDPAAG